MTALIVSRSENVASITLGTTNGSSRRFKTHIKPMDKASESIRALKPVTFCYAGDNKSTLQFGLIAEDVVEVNPELTVRDKTGKLVSVLRCGGRDVAERISQRTP
jgi:hypothetical protein